MKIQVNEKHDIDLSQIDRQPDIIQSADGRYHMIWQHASYTVDDIAVDLQAKTIAFSMNDKSYHLQVQDDFDILVQQLGLSLNTAQKITDIKSPMPGLVLDIMVSAGDTVSEGTPLLILEAMKMENVIKSPGEGVIKAIHVNQGDSIEKKAIMIEME